MTVTAARAEAPLTLAEPAPPGLGLRETFGLWTSLGVSLLLPVAASFVVLAGRPLRDTVLAIAIAIAIGTVIGAVLPSLAAAPAARGAWDVSDDAPARPALLLPWAVGFVAHQLTVPTYFVGTAAGWTSWWAARSADLGVPGGLSAPIVSLTVASLLTVAVALPGALRAHRSTA